MTAKRQLEPSANALRVAERYLETLLDTDAPLAPGELESIQESIEMIRQGRMTLAEFERKHGL
ncbi:MAG TPA: hypothetical protein VG672_12880 [Bryobacteraceae bacterium]|jgi:hypothetical protein|nr:hypothetical protein [Bryobacteraceae bacterium]